MDYKKKILKYNSKPLEKRELDIEMNSTKKIKKYYYSFEEKMEEALNGTLKYRDSPIDAYLYREIYKLNKKCRGLLPKYAWIHPENLLERISIENLRNKIRTN